MKTRTINFRDGRREIQRVLSTQDLADWKGGESLAYERSIVWLENIDRLPFVRVVEVRCAKSRRGRLVLKGPERVIGYSKLMADTPRDSRTARFTRRLFYLKVDDESLEVPPDRTVDPRSVLPGVSGKPPAPPQLKPLSKRA
jgi:Family of unknown function (DUF6009)